MTENKPPKVIEYAWGATADEHAQYICGDIPYFRRGRFLTESPILSAHIPQFRSVQVYEHTESNGILGNSGLLYRPTGYDFIPFDIDSQDTYEAVLDARKFIKWLELYGIYDYSIYWSGSKGIHITIPWVQFNREYVDYTPAVLKMFVDRYVIPLSKVKTLDLSVYHNRSLFRVENTRNVKTGFFKIPLTREELFHTDIGDLEILALSDRQDFVPEVRKKSDYSSFQTMYDLSVDAVQINNERQMVFEDDGGYRIQPISFVEEFINEARLQPGSRHLVSLTLAAYYRARGMNQQETENMLSDFMQRATGSSTPVLQRIRESKNDVKTCYARDVRFSMYKAREVFAE